MTTRTRILTGATALVLAATSLGCGLIDKVGDIANTAGILGDFASRLENAKTLTYTAEYAVTGGDKKKKKDTTVTLVQQPPNSAVLGTDGRFIVTDQFTYLCSKEDGGQTCQKTAYQGADAGANAGLLAGITGAGFVTPELALGLVAAAAFVPGAKVSQSNRTIAGQDSLCADVTNLEAVHEAAGKTPDASDVLSDFSVCVTEEGALASFKGSLQNGEAGGIELTSYSDKVNESAFSPPKGAKIVDRTVIEPS